jgi:hypothetical protein
MARFCAYRHKEGWIEELWGGLEGTSRGEGRPNGLRGFIRLVTAFVGDVGDSGGDSETLRATFDRVGVGEAGLVATFALIRFEDRGVGDAISTYTRGS